MTRMRSKAKGLDQPAVRQEDDLDALPTIEVQGTPAAQLILRRAAPAPAGDEQAAVPTPKVDTKRRQPAAAAAAKAAARARVEDQLASAEAQDQKRRASALQLYAGKLVERIPRQMRVGTSETIEVRLGTEGTSNLALGLLGSGPTTSHDLPIVETMALDLYSPDNAFTIEPLSDREQLVKKDALVGTPLAALSDPYGRWMWRVTALSVGAKKLALRVSARVLDSHGHPTPHTLVPDRVIEVDVLVNRNAVARRIAWWAAVTVPIAIGSMLVAAAVQDDMWPVIKQFFNDLL